MDQIVIPFLNPHRSAFDRLAIIGFHQRGGVSGLGKRTLCVEQRATGKKMLHGKTSS
ncbi:hypothetical protein SDC9_170781 [bioreactor metagenome]|uniref:Uncharacterized protein n=1 Tax=bioreactor metagenome TaxID=1076179 RepID=A0A645GI38_9ZZZZ